jgi:iron complex transport system ATP-binding protein
VLIDASFSIAGGEWLGLIGPNGAGKSTLLRAIVGLHPHSGTIAVGDDDGTAAGRGASHRSRVVAYVPQAPVLPPGMTVGEYVLLGRSVHLGWLGRESAADRAAAATALDRLELTRFAHRDLSALSGGEVQRVSLARAIASGCPVLVLDEPTSALDIGHQIAVLELVDELRHEDGLTVIAAMHDLTAAGRFADRLLLLSCGSTVAFGAPAEVLTEQQLSEFYQTPVTVMHAPDGTVVVVPLRTPRS